MILVPSLTGTTSLGILNFNNLLVHILKFIGIIDRSFFVIGLITQSREEQMFERILKRLVGAILVGLRHGRILPLV